MSEITQGANGRIGFKRNLGNYNGIEVYIEGSKEDVAEEMPYFIDLVAELVKGVNNKLGSADAPDSPKPAEVDRGSTNSDGDDDIGITVTPPEDPLEGIDQQGDANEGSSEVGASRDGVVLYTEKVPLDAKPTRAIDADGEPMSYTNKKTKKKEKLYACPNETCPQVHAIYENEYKGKKQYNFSCSRHKQYGSELNCGTWCCWPVSEGLPE